MTKKILHLGVVYILVQVFVSVPFVRATFNSDGKILPVCGISFNMPSFLNSGLEQDADFDATGNSSSKPIGCKYRTDDDSFSILVFDKNWSNLSDFVKDKITAFDRYRQSQDQGEIKYFSQSPYFSTGIRSELLYKKINSDSVGYSAEIFQDSPGLGIYQTVTEVDNRYLVYLTYKLPVSQTDWDNYSDGLMSAVEINADQFFDELNTITADIGIGTNLVNVCTDSDGGKKYYEQGGIIANPNTNIASKYSDYCSKNYRNEVSQCSGGNCFVFENYCDTDNTASVEVYACPNGCANGACISSGTTTTATTTTQPRLLPPAGYEDEVITNPENYQNPFPDTAINSLEGKAAAELYRRGVIGGFSDGEFKGNRPVNRAEAAKFLLLAKGVDVGDLKNNGKFRDVKSGEWYEKFVMKAAEKRGIKREIISGYPDGSFRPANTVNTAEFLKMLTRTFELSENLNHNFADVPNVSSGSDVWFAPFAGTAKKYDLFPNRGNRFLEPVRNLTRDEVAVAIYQFLKGR